MGAVKTTGGAVRERRIPADRRGARRRKTRQVANPAAAHQLGNDMNDYDDDFRHQAEQQRDMERMAATAREALARCVGVAMTDEEAEAICCLCGLSHPKVRKP